MNKPGPAYQIHTARMVLRCWEPVDAPLIAKALIESRDHLMPWMPWAANEPIELSQRVKWLRKFRGEFDLDQDYIYGVFTPDESRVIGGTGLHTHVGEAARRDRLLDSCRFHPPGPGDRIVCCPYPGRL